MAILRKAANCQADPITTVGIDLMIRGQKQQLLNTGSMHLWYRHIEKAGDYRLVSIDINGNSVGLTSEVPDNDDELWAKLQCVLDEQSIAVAQSIADAILVKDDTITFGNQVFGFDEFLRESYISATPKVYSAKFTVDCRGYYNVVASGYIRTTRL